MEPNPSSPDVDNGWAFVVLLCAVVNQMLTYGLSYSNSLFYAIFLDEFEESPVSTAWAVNMNLFCALAFGLIGNCLVVTFGHRISITIGCFLSTTGIIATSFLNSSINVLIMFGIVSGTGFAITTLPTLLMVSIYFEKYRVIAISITTIGISFGQFIYAPFIRYLVEEYHWRGNFMILGAVNLNMFVSVAAFMPPRVYRGDVVGTASEEDGKVLKHKTNAIKIIKELFSDILVFQNPLWLLYCLGQIFMYTANGGLITHIFKFGLKSIKNYSPLQITFLPSIIGIGGIGGRLLMGPVTYLTNIHVVLGYILINCLIVIVCIALSFTNNYVVIAVCCFFAGVSFGGNAIVYEVITHIVGTKRYGSGVSFSLLFSGIGFLIGGPFAAWIYEIDPSYVWSFRMSAIMKMVGILHYIPSWLALDDWKIHQRRSTNDLLLRPN